MATEFAGPRGRVEALGPMGAAGFMTLAGGPLKHPIRIRHIMEYSVYQ